MVSNSQDTDLSPKDQFAEPWTAYPALDWVSGGISTVPDGAVAWGRAADEEIALNRESFLKRRGLDPRRAVALDQTHSDRVITVGVGDAGRGIFESETRIPAADGMLTQEPGLVLVTSHADCAPLFLADPDNRAIGLIHAGWKGILAGICGKAVREMEQWFGSKPRSLLVAVGPMISTARYEIGEDLVDRFCERFGPQMILSVEGTPHLDLFGCIVTDLLANGVSGKLLPPRPPCTYSNKLYSSYRRSGSRAGGMIAYSCIC